MRYRYEDPVETPRKKQYGNNYYRFHSRKLGRVVTAHTDLEQYYLIKLEMDPDVVYYCEHPLKVHLRDSLGREETRIPDAYVCFRDGKEEIAETMYSAGCGPATEDPGSVRAGIRRMERWCRDNGMYFRVFTEKDLVVGKSVQNLRYLCHRIRMRRPPDERIRLGILEYAGSGPFGGTTFKEIGELIDAPYSLIVDCAAFMYWNGEIDIPDVFSDTALHLNSAIVLRRQCGKEKI